MITRKKCILCTSANMAEIYRFKRFPIYMGSISLDDHTKPIKKDMVWVECTNCGQVQLKNLIKPEILYFKSHNPAIGKTWELHHKSFSEFIINNSINLNEKNVIELGGGNLKLYSLLKEHINSYTVIDNSSYGDSNDDPKLAFKKTLFNNYKEKNKYDIILHSHTFEHFYNPIREMKKLNKLLKIDGKLLASIPNVGKVIEDGYGNGVNFEHTFVVTKNNVEKFFTQSGFKILEIVDYNKYNFFVYATKTRNCSSEILDKISYENQKDMFLAFATKTKNFVMKIKEETEKEKEKYFFGCHIFTQYLLSFNKKIQNDFVGILDNDLSKVGQKLYGTELITYHPDKIKNDTKPCVVLAAGVYNNEIKKQLASINQNIKLVMM